MSIEQADYQAKEEIIVTRAQLDALLAQAKRLQQVVKKLEMLAEIAVEGARAGRDADWLDGRAGAFHMAAEMVKAAIETV